MTVEFINRRFLDKIKSIQALYVDAQSLHAQLITDDRVCKELKSMYVFVNCDAEQFAGVAAEYMMSTSALLCDISSTGENPRSIEHFQQIVGSENFASQIDENLSVVKRSIKAMLASYCNGSETLEHFDPMHSVFDNLLAKLESADAIKLHSVIAPTEYDTCDCGSVMALTSVPAELLCAECGCVKLLMGTATDDTKPATRTRQKHGSYDPARHFRTWMDRIQAKKPNSIPEETLQRIKDIIDRDRLALNNVYAMREILKELRLTKYNDHAPYFMKLFTKHSPPQFTINQQAKFIGRFTQIMTTLSDMKGTRSNRPYYPYFIYKIIEIEITELRAANAIVEAIELSAIFKYIYLQANETLQKHDHIYKKVCERLGGVFKFAATTRMIY